MASISVPRARDLAGHKSPDEIAAEREWHAARKRFADARALANHHGRNLSRAEWKRITRETRSR